MTMREVLDEKERKMQAEAVSLLNKQIDVEREIIGLCRKTAENVESPAVRHLLHSIELDSAKHIHICQTSIEILSGEELAREEKQQFTEELERHIELEKDSIDRVGRIKGIQLVRENKGVDRLMKNLSDDEKRHHKMLRKLISQPFYRVDPNDFGFIMLGEEIIRRRQEKGLTTATPRKRI